MAVAAVSLTAGRASGPAPEAIRQSYVTTTGAECHLEIVPHLDGTDLSGRLAVLAGVAAVDLQSLDIARYLPRPAEGLLTADEELDAVEIALARHAERLLVGGGPVIGRVQLDIAHDCGGDASVVQTGARPADGSGLFRASTGELCEVRWWVDPDPLLADDGSLAAARAYLASTDPATVEPGGVDTEPDSSTSFPVAVTEALAVSRAVMLGMRETVAADFPLSYGLQPQIQVECR